MSKLMKLDQRTAVVTGAASGIGRAISLSLARRGARLALVDIDAGGLAETAGMAAASAAEVSVHRLDVADREAVAAFPESLLACHPGLDILVNNAGVALGGVFEQIPEEDFEWLFEINFWAVVRMTRAFLPVLKASDEARIVNMSSVFGLIASPRQTAYAASKFAVRGFSESLRQELWGTSVGVTVVHPGGVATAIARNARYSEAVPPEQLERDRKSAARFMTLPPERAGEVIVEGIARRRPRVVVGSDARLVSVVERLAPVSYPRWLSRVGLSP